ncbi:aromatic acid exporter family protein [Cetobacterium sp. SF1]|uniref:aromatic acid exporter family protein n=1 Tax=unclassified Cetobacterium TaxID=2630983 RepID=UPI003CEB0001
MKYLDHKIIKTAVGAALAVMLANMFGIVNGVTAGIVTIISIQSTKKESLKIAFERFIASIIGLGLSSILFYYLGYTPLILGLFILIFMPLCIRFNLFQGFLVTVVLSTHLLGSKNSSLEFLLNELSILVLGSLVAILLNLYMPNINKKIHLVQSNIDTIIKKILNRMSDDLKCNCVSIDEEKLFFNLKNEIDHGRNLALTEYNNDLFGDSTYFMDLFIMKRAQYKILSRMRSHFRNFYITYDQSLMMSNFTKQVSLSVGIEKLVPELLEALFELKTIFKNMELPKTREEFENRATLFQFLNDLEDFLQVKTDFIKKYNS